MQRYIKDPAKARPIVAVQFNFDPIGNFPDGFEYKKWGGSQRCKRGDWIVFNASCDPPDTYTIDAESFANTYTRVRDGQYVKTGHVWAEQVHAPTVIVTKEGQTPLAPGDYAVYNNPDRTDGYGMSRASFEAMYTLAPLNQPRVPVEARGDQQ